MMPFRLGIFISQLVVITLLTGCAGFRRAPTDEELLRAMADSERDEDSLQGDFARVDRLVANPEKRSEIKSEMIGKSPEFRKSILVMIPTMLAPEDLRQTDSEDFFNDDADRRAEMDQRLIRQARRNRDADGDRNAASHHLDDTPRERSRERSPDPRQSQSIRPEPDREPPAHSRQDRNPNDRIQRERDDHRTSQARDAYPPPPTRQEPEPDRVSRRFSDHPRDWSDPALHAQRSPSRAPNQAAPLPPAGSSYVQQVGFDQPINQADAGAKSDAYISPATRRDVIGPDSPSGVQPTSRDYREALDTAIEQLEEQVYNTKDPDVAKDLEKRLRILYAAAGRRDSAVLPVYTESEEMQAFWSQMLWGMSTQLESDEMLHEADRNADTLTKIREAARMLSKATQRLEVKNLYFCTDVQSFGKFNELAPDFKAGETVLLYFEVENFFARKAKGGFETRLRGSYDIYTPNGVPVANREYPVMKEVCRNYRRDFFMGYHVPIPRQLEPGNYTLQLRVEDELGKKVGQGAIDFVINDDV